MILTPKIILRLAIIGMVTVVLEVSFFSRLILIGATPEIAVLVAIVIGLLGGVMVGAVMGFLIGIAIDALVGAPLGASALVFMLAGYVAGVYRERTRREAGPLALPAACAIAFVLSEAALVAVYLLLGLTGPISFDVVPDILLKTVYAFGLSIPVYAAVRGLLRPGIVEEAPFKRRKGSGIRLGVFQG